MRGVHWTQNQSVVELELSLSNITALVKSAQQQQPTDDIQQIVDDIDDIERTLELLRNTAGLVWAVTQWSLVKYTVMLRLRVAGHWSAPRSH